MAYGIISTKMEIHDAPSTFWIPDIRFAASGMTPPGVPVPNRLEVANPDQWIMVEGNPPVSPPPGFANRAVAFTGIGIGG